MLYGWPNYSGIIDYQKEECALFMICKRTNVDIKDVVCLHIVLVVQHPNIAQQ